MRKVLNIIEKIMIFVSVIAIIIGIAIAFLHVHKNEDNIFKFGNIYLIEVNDKEMSPEFKLGDLVFIENRNPKEYHINNIISYYVADGDGNITTKVSRIVDGYSNDSATSYIFIVKSDNNNDKTTISGGDVIGEWTGAKITNGAIIINFMVSRIGLIICTILPLVILFVLEFILLILDYLYRDKFSYNN